MADPISIISLVEGSLGLMMQCGNVAKSLHDLAGRYKQAKITLLSMVQELDTIKMAWSRIREWSQVHGAAGTDSKFCDRLSQSLECGALVLSALEQDLAGFDMTNETFGFRRRSKVMWNDQALKDHQNRVRGQVSAMTLLLQALELPRRRDRDKLLRVSEHTFQKSDESAYSIVPSKMSSKMSVSTRARDSCISLESTEMTYLPFSFENDLFTTKVYKRNYRNRLMYLGSQPKKVVEFTARRASFMRTTRRNLNGAQQSPAPTEDVVAFEDTHSDLTALPPRSFKDTMNNDPAFSSKSPLASKAGNLEILNKALQEAVRLGSVKRVVTLLARGVEVDNASNSLGRSPLHSAAANGDLAVANLLLKQGATVGIQADDLVQPIHSACKKGSYELASILLDNGATLNCSDMFDRQPLHCAPDLIYLLLDRGAQSDALALVTADYDGGRGTPMYLACGSPGYTANVEALLKRGVKFWGGSNRRSCLERALGSCCYEIVRIILQRHQRDSGSDTPSDRDNYAMLSFAREYDFRPWDVAADKKMFQIFLECKWNIRFCSSNGDQVLHYLAYPKWRGDPDFDVKCREIGGLIEDLIAAGADINAVNNKMKTPFMLAYECYNLSFILESLVDYSKSALR